MAYEYDAAGNRTRVTWPDAFYADYAYDALGRLETVSENGTTTLATYAYDVASRVTTLTLVNNTSTTFTYEDDSSLDTVAHVMPQATGGAVAYTFDYNNVN